MRERLKELSAKINRRQKVEKTLAGLEIRKNELFNRIYELQTQLEKEEQDVERLEGFSLTGLFLSILGSKEEELEKERREAYAAQVRVQTAQGELNAVRYEIERYTAELKETENCEEEYSNLLSKLVNDIRLKGGSDSEDKFILNERISYIDCQLQEISEAVNAGRAALYEIENIKSSLKSAKNWSVVDMLGGDLISTLAKHDKMNKAQDGIYNLQRALTHFRSELTDVDVDSNIQVTADGFLTFADLWFDGLFADFMVHDKIKQASEQIDRTESQIKLVITRLEEMQRELDTERQYMSRTLNE